jgi:hypothetical protein
VLELIVELEVSMAVGAGTAVSLYARVFRSKSYCRAHRGGQYAIINDG